MIWHDPMLNFEAYEGAHCLQNLSLSYRMVESIWNPSVCIVNSKSSRIHESPVPNVFMAIFSNGTVWINYRIALESPCEFDFSLFPMDRIVCSLHIESYSFNVGKCRLHWKRVGVPIVIEEIRLPDFTHTKYTHEKKNYFYPAGDWDRQQLPARITLTISSLMSLTLQNANVSKQLPKVSYLKAIDVFMFTNIGYIFLSIVELAVVGMLEKEKKDLEMKEKGKRFTFAKGIAKSMTKSFRDRSSKTNRHHHVLTAAPSDPDSYTRNLWTRELAKTSTFHQVQQPDPIDDATLSLTKSKELERRKNIFKSSNESDKQSNQKSRTNSTTFVQKWNSEDMDKLARKVFPLSYCCVNLVYWMYVTAKAQEGA
uniref:Neur_chan_LBD domain-containing protein n=1 Tax=Rhabditophanes sp. KR3021 TaxID=114890 RepID=A0AC35U215_9BILA